MLDNKYILIVDRLDGGAKWIDDKLYDEIPSYRFPYHRYEFVKLGDLIKDINLPIRPESKMALET